LQRFGHVVVGHRAEQAAVDAGLLGDAHGAAGSFSPSACACGQLLGGGLFEVGALLLELLDRRLGGAARVPWGSGSCARSRP
jgi:hypothetical protein